MMNISVFNYKITNLYLSEETLRHLVTITSKLMNRITSLLLYRTFLDFAKVLQMFGKHLIFGWRQR